MRPSVVTSAFSLLAGANLVLAACEIHSFTTCDDGIVHWFDPRNGEVCDPKDCGGGRAPPRTDVPGCPLYSGTILSVPVSYLSCWTPSSAVPSATSEAVVTREAVVTSANSASDVGRTTAVPASETSAAESTVESSTPSSAATTSAASASSQTSAKIPITSPATLSTKTQPTHAASSNATSASSSKAATSTSTSTANAGHAIGGSLMAAAGIAIGAIALL